MLRSARTLRLEPQLRWLYAAFRGNEARRNLRDDGRLSALIRALPSDANCVDIGANVGSVLEEMVRAAPHGQHVAFEPLPHSRPRPASASRTLMSGTLRSRPNPAVATSRMSWIEASLSGFHTDGSEVGSAVEMMTVETATLDGSLAQSFAPALIKIDVEGAELDVLEGARKTIGTHRPVVAFGTRMTRTPAIYELLCQEMRLQLYDMDAVGPLSLTAFQELVRTGHR